MNELTGKIKDLNFDYFSGKAILSLTINENSVKSLYDEMIGCEKLSIKITKYREKRSLNANAYFWKLCDELAQVLSDTTKMKHTKEDIYRNAVRERGIYKDFQGLSQTDAKTLRHAWELLGTGWITEQVDFMPDGENVIVRCYYGSSTYNKKQMSRLIDNVVQDCKAVGIETKTPDEIRELINLWEGK